MAKFIENTGSVSQDESIYPAHFNTLNYICQYSGIGLSPNHQISCHAQAREGGGGVIELAIL